MWKNVHSMTVKKLMLTMMRVSVIIHRHHHFFFFSSFVEQQPPFLKYLFIYIFFSNSAMARFFRDRKYCAVWMRNKLNEQQKRKGKNLNRVHVQHTAPMTQKWVVDVVFSPLRKKRRRRRDLRPRQVLKPLGMTRRRGGYTRLYSFRLSCRMVSFTAANTNLIFSVSVAHVKCE